MDKKNYTKLQDLKKIFPFRKDSLAQRAKKEDLLEKVVSQAKACELFFTIDGTESEGSIKSFFYNRYDYRVTIVLTDDDGHTRVIDSEESLEGYMNEVGAEKELFLASESPRLKEWRVVYNRYYISCSGRFNALAMLDRLVELGDGKRL